MDQERQVRFLYPPFFFVMSLLFGLILDPSRSLSDIVPALKTSTSDSIEILGAAGGWKRLCSGFRISDWCDIILVAQVCIPRLWKAPLRGLSNT